MLWVVLGDTGQVGSRLAAFLRVRQENVKSFSRRDFSVEDSIESLSKLIPRADVIVNAVGYTDVEKAETDQIAVFKVNAQFVEKLSTVANLAGARLFHISTDYVFNGFGRKPYRISDPPNPINVYGHSKLLGEKFAGAANQSTIFRTSWLYSSSDSSFPLKIAHKLIETGACTVVNDQIGNPTWVDDLISVIYAHGINEYSESIVHASSSGYGSWFDFARLVAKSLPNGDDYFLGPIVSDSFIGDVQRPKYSVLDNSETRGPIIGHWIDRWQAAEASVLSKLRTQ